MIATLLLSILGAAAAAPRLPEGLQLVMFGAAWCEACPAQKDVLLELRRAGFPVAYADADDPQNRRILHAQQLDRLPAWIIYRDRRPVGRSMGIWPKRGLIEWITRESLSDQRPAARPVAPIDREFLIQNHYRLSAPSCGLLGCPIH